MTDSTLHTLLIIFTIAFVAPFLADRLRPLPAVLLEIVLGVVVGPAVLGWAHDDAIISAFSSFGLTMLMFLAGYEIEFGRIRGTPLRLALLGWLLGLPVAFVVGVVVGGWGTAAIYVGLPLATTALGTILPIVRDAGYLSNGFGARILAIGAVGEFAPIVAMALLLSGRRPGSTALLLLAFGVLAAAAAVLASRPQHPALARLMKATLGTSGQLAVRLAVLIVVVMVWVTEEFGLDTLLGAFSAGVVLRLFLSAGDASVARSAESKLDAIGFGLLIPLFFVVSGIRFDLRTLLSEPYLLALVPAFVVLLLVIRGVPTLVLYRRDEALGGPRDRRALALFASTALPLVVVITSLGVDSGDLSAGMAAALVGAGMLSVLLFPLLALRVRGPRHDPDDLHPSCSGTAHLM